MRRWPWFGIALAPIVGLVVAVFTFVGGSAERVLFAICLIAYGLHTWLWRDRWVSIVERTMWPDVESAIGVSTRVRAQITVYVFAFGLPVFGVVYLISVIT